MLEAAQSLGGGGRCGSCGRYLLRTLSPRLPDAASPSTLPTAVTTCWGGLGFLCLGLRIDSGLGRRPAEASHRAAHRHSWWTALYSGLAYCLCFGYWGFVFLGEGWRPGVSAAMGGKGGRLYCSALRSRVLSQLAIHLAFSILSAIAHDFRKRALALMDQGPFYSS